MNNKDFISNYLLANSGTMVPRRYHIWSAFSILAMAASRHIYVDHSHYEIRTPLYITLVGRQAIRKTSAKDSARAMLREALPDYPTGASVMSREQIVVRLAEDSSMRVYTDETGALVEERPMAFFINELKNFMSINPGAMVEFLTDIYDTKFFAADTIKHGLQPIVNPCINILACETPEWIIDKLKLNIIAGGFSRRMLFVYETERPKRITFPVKTDEAYAAEKWCIEHLRKVATLAGKFTWTNEARSFFDAWFTSLPSMSDPVLEGFYEAKDVLATKIAMLVAVANPEPRLELTLETLQKGIVVLESIEDNLPRLTIAVGRNELAITHQKLIQVLEDSPGKRMDEIAWRRLAAKDLNEMEYASVKKFLLETEQIKFVRRDAKSTKQIVMTMAEYDRLLESGELT